eukprot:TRINITY_DN55920_c0_g1_i1.p1 TRINITY_DN55920_c0_g1~~TRINITY_DN55920_c0_g1_i1.p1  ORF type:complete len:297 (+),score=28.91 TRINITY_DN55920_c0_g1_i1:111-893(+)
MSLLENELAVWCWDENQAPGWHIAIGTGPAVDDVAPPEKRQKVGKSRKDRPDERPECHLALPSFTFGILSTELADPALLRVPNDTSMVLQERQVLLEFVLPGHELKLHDIDACRGFKSCVSFVIAVKDNEVGNNIYDHLPALGIKLDISVADTLLGISTCLKPPQAFHKTKDKFHCTDVAMHPHGCQILIGVRPNVEAAGGAIVWGSIRGAITGTAEPMQPITKNDYNPMALLGKIVEKPQDFFARMKAYCGSQPATSFV